MLAFDLWPCWKGVAVDVEGWRMGCFFFFSFGAVGSFHGREMPCLEKCGLVMVFLGFGALRWLWFWCGLYYC